MRSERSPSSTERFLGVRLTADEVDKLDRFQRAQGLATRSDAVRALVRVAEVARPEGLELPVTLRAQLETIVEDGWASDAEGALTLAVHLGLNELSRLHGERLPALRRAARDVGDRQTRRRRAAREGRGLLER
ncbi:MAG: hypothetical protein WCA77_09780 [Thermoplasmata archaeon]